jgi:hypothetical protein
VKRLALLVVGTLAVIALTSGHAAATTSPLTGATSCSSMPIAGADTFDGLASLGATSGIAARGVGNLVGREPAMNANLETLPDNARGKGGKGFRASVPVWFHVISDGPTGNLTDKQIAAQMNALNLGFAGFYGGAKSGFSFTLAGVTRTDNAGWYNAGYGSKAERDLKHALHRGGFETLNVYSNLAGGYLGYAYLPGLPDSRLYEDGIILNWESVPGASTTFAGAYDLGMTLVHETGHWVNLEHTFQGACNANGDYVDDTPAMSEPTRGCPEGKDTCPAPGLDPIHNYMDYSYDSCYTQFTAGQVSRAQDSWLYFRAP